MHLLGVDKVQRWHDKSTWFFERVRIKKVNIRPKGPHKHLFSCLLIFNVLLKEIEYIGHPKVQNIIKHHKENKRPIICTAYVGHSYHQSVNILNWLMEFRKSQYVRSFGSLMELKPANQHDSTDLWQCHVCAWHLSQMPSALSHGRLICSVIMNIIKPQALGSKSPFCLSFQY